jgi:hypothetical protein
VQFGARLYFLPQQWSEWNIFSREDHPDVPEVARKMASIERLKIMEKVAGIRMTVLGDTDHHSTAPQPQPQREQTTERKHHQRKGHGTNKPTPTVNMNRHIPDKIMAGTIQVSTHYINSADADIRSSESTVMQNLSVRRSSLLRQASLVTERAGAGDCLTRIALFYVTTTAAPRKRSYLCRTVKPINLRRHLLVAHR